MAMLENISPALMDQKVTIYFNDGSEPLKGEIVAYSRYEFLFVGPEGQIVLFKQSIRGIKPDKPIEVKKLLGSREGKTEGSSPSQTTTPNSAKPAENKTSKDVFESKPRPKKKQVITF